MTLRLAVIADVHLAPHRKFGGEGPVNCRAADVLTALYGATRVAVSSESHAVVIAGDVFDTDRPAPQLIAEFQRWCSDHLSQLGTRPRLVVGNHDRRSNVAGDHALSPLVEHAEVIDTVRWDLDGVLYVPFRTAPRGWFEADVASYARPSWAVIGHVGVCFQDTPPWLWGKADALTVAEMVVAVQPASPKVVVVGNYHAPGSEVRGGLRIEQCGTFTPAGWDDPGDGYGQVVVVDSDGGCQRTEVPGPRFYSGSVRPEHLSRRVADGCTVYYRCTVRGGEGVPEEYVLDGVKVDRDVDSSEVRAQGAEAVAAARGASTFQQALSVCVSKMPLHASITAAEVEQRVARIVAQS